MIKLTTDCNTCVHKKMCKYTRNAELAMKKLKNMTYGTGPNDDYDWGTMMDAEHVDITFSCPDYMKLVTTREKVGF